MVRVLWHSGEDGEQQLRGRLGAAGVPVIEVRAAPVDLESAFAFLAEGVGP